MIGKEYLKTMVQLATTGFGLVAALAWNDAIQTLFKEIFHDRSGVISKFAYATVVTIIIVFITAKIGKLAEREEKNTRPEAKS